jgi:hypothetical protein
MDYSAATAPLAFGKALFTLPHLIVGVGALVAAVKGKVNPFIALGGLVFVGVVGYVWISDAVLSVQCRQSAIKNDGTKVSGEVAGVVYSVSRGGQRSVRFSVGDHLVTSWTSGLNNDCGFIESVGRVYRPENGQKVDVLLYQGQLTRLTVR